MWTRPSPALRRLYNGRRRLSGVATWRGRYLACATLLVATVVHVRIRPLVGRWGQRSVAVAWTVQTENVDDDYGALVPSTFGLGGRPWLDHDFYAGLPVSEVRPVGQYYARAAADGPGLQIPIMTIVTATRDPRDEFFARTVRFVLNQSLQSFRWVIVNDHSTSHRALRRLDGLKRWAAEHEPRRIVMVDSPSPYKHGNGPAAMNYGLRYVGRSPFVVILDDDDMWELTSLEKAALVMSWVPDAYAVSFDVANHGNQTFVWTRGFHNGDESFFTENNLMQGCPFRASVLEKCRFREDMSDGGADWDFWMCMASHGMWGMHVPELGNWYQWNPPEFRGRRWGAVTSRAATLTTRARLQRRYPALLNERAWPRMVLPASHGSEGDFRAGIPFANWHAGRNSTASPLAHDLASKRVMLVVEEMWNANSSPARNAVKAVRQLATAGWRVTVLVTHYSDEFRDPHNPARLELFRFTHDVFVAPDVAPLHRFPDLLAYLMASRAARVVVVVAATPGHAEIVRPLNAEAALLLHDRAFRSEIDRLSHERIAVLEWATGPGELSANLRLLSVSTCRNALWSAPTPIAGSSSRPGTGILNAVERASAALLQLPDAVPSQNLCRQSISQAVEQRQWPRFVRREDRTFLAREMDMREIQGALQRRKARHGFGRALQIACPERVYSNTRWIDGLEQPVVCGGEHDDPLPMTSADADALKTSAVSQCGARCIANLDAPEGRDQDVVIGWEFTGACFKAIFRVDLSSLCMHTILKRSQRDGAVK